MEPTIGRLLATGAEMAYGLFYSIIASANSITRKNVWFGLTIGHLLGTAAGLAYGLFYLAIALAWSMTQKEFWCGRTFNNKVLQQQASRKLWSLQEDMEGMQHEFLQLADGTQLHYLSQVQAKLGVNSLVIFLHGFPDSAHLFAHQLRRPLPQQAHLVALDLPGVGGSDSIERYGPNVLDVVSEAIVILKKRYFPRMTGNNRRCVLVGHDWGGVIGFRLAAETVSLFDHFIAINSLHPAFAEEQVLVAIEAAKKSLSEWRCQEAINLFAPVLSQLWKSSYTYMVTLPLPLAKLIPGLTLSLIRFAHEVEYEQAQPPSPEDLATRLAMACGPGPKESVSTAKDGSAYGTSVYARSKTKMPGDWDGRVKLYAQGLLRQKWTPSYPGHIPLPTDVDRKHFKYPVTVMFGVQDIALDPRIAVDDIERYFLPAPGPRKDPQNESMVVRLPKCGHWSLLEKQGQQALEAVLCRVV